MNDTTMPTGAIPAPNAPAPIGHNGGPALDAPAQLAESAVQLRTIVERIERMAEEKQAIADDIKEVYAEAKANGFDTKILRVIVALRKLDSNERQERDALRDLYLQALGMLRA